MPANDPILPVKLPKDELEHRQEAEWWYFVGHLEDSLNRYAFEFTAVRLHLPLVAPFYYAFFSFIEIDNQTYLAADRHATPSAYSSNAEGIQLRFPPPMNQPGDWTLRTIKGGDLPEYALNATFRLPEPNPRPRSLGLRLVSEKKATLHGVNGDGVVDFGSNTMGYYSRTRLEVSPGAVMVGSDIRNVTGSAWMDHQWGPVRFFDQRWKFFGIQLDDGRDFLFYRVVKKDGTLLATAGCEVNQLGTATTRFSSVNVTDNGVLWQGYPLENSVAFGSGKLFKIAPAFAEQRRVPTGKTPLPLLTFWEGACTVADNGGNVIGHAFTELGGYE